MKTFFALLLAVSAPAHSQISLNDVVQLRNLGEPLNSLHLGAAKESSYLRYDYVVEGCPIEIEVDRSQEKNIVAIAVQASQACQKSPIGSQLGAQLPPLKSLTFGQLETVLGPAKYTADCLLLCGNAANPFVHASWPQFTASVELVEPSSIDASDRWQQIIQSQHDDDYVIDTVFNCTQEYNTQAARLFKDVRVSVLVLRKPMPLPECSL